MNKYAYCEENPLKYKDPSGNIPLNIAGIVIGAGGGAMLGTAVADCYKLTGYKRNLTIAGFAVGGAVIGNFAGAVVNKLALKIAVKMQVASWGLKGTGKLAFESGKAGEKYLSNLVGGKSQKYFNTSYGRRFIDVFSKDRIAHESKVGYASLTKFIRKQVLKDAELLKSKQIRGVVWHFFKSEKTGKIGASKPLLNFLKENGIDYIIHK